MYLYHAANSSLVTETFASLLSLHFHVGLKLKQQYLVKNYAAKM